MNHIAVFGIGALYVAIIMVSDREDAVRKRVQIYNVKWPEKKDASALLTTPSGLEPFGQFYLLCKAGQIMNLINHHSTRDT